MLPDPSPSLPRSVTAGLRMVLCDADGNLFPSEEPAFDASVRVANAFLAALGSDRRYTADELRHAATGMSFRTTARMLAETCDRDDVDLEPWVAEERSVVTAHLGASLRPHPPTLSALERLAGRYPLAAVSSSALARLAVCFTATGLDGLVPPDRRYSAEDSLPAPASKPDPAVYLHACAALGIAPGEGLAVEDAVAGVRSAVAAGCPAVGNLLFVAAEERPDRAAALLAAGALTIVDSWSQLADLLLADASDAGELSAAGAGR